MLTSAIKTFSDNLSALRHFAQLVGSLLDERKQELLKGKGRDLIPIILLFNQANLVTLSKDHVEQLENNFGSKLEMTQKTDEKGDSKWSIQFEDSNWDAKSVFNFLTIEIRHTALLHRSALISLVSAAEWFLSQVIRTYFEKFPGAAGLADKTLTLEQLKSIGSIDDARRYLIDLRIDEIMWGGFDDWLKFLTGTVKLSAGYLSADRPALVEVFQRRNVMVHNNGLIHSSYLQKVNPELRKGLSQGQELSVSREYLAKAIDLVEKNFILLAAELWKQLEPDQEGRADVMTAVAFERLTEEHWNVSEGLSLFTMQDKKLSERSLLIAQLNYWQSIKWQGRFDEIKDQVQSADFSAKDDLFRLGRTALLDENSEFFKIVPSAIKNKKLTREMLATWPIFQNIRKDARFKKYQIKTDDTKGKAKGKKRPTKITVV